MSKQNVANVKQRWNFASDPHTELPAKASLQTLNELIRHILCSVQSDHFQDRVKFIYSYYARRRCSMAARM